MKKLENCNNAALLVALLMVGIVMVMGAYRIFSYLCELPTIAEALPILLILAALVLTVVGILLARTAFRRLKELHDRGEV